MLNVLPARQQHEDIFAEYLERNVDLQTIKSRMLRESERLIAAIRSRMIYGWLRLTRDKLVRDVAGAMLTKMGREVVLANDGLEAVNLYKAAAESSEPIHLMDLTIPGGMGVKMQLKWFWL